MLYNQIRNADSRVDMAMLDRLAGLADQKHSCGYEDAVPRGPQARVSDNHAAPLGQELQWPWLACVNVDQQVF